METRHPNPSTPGTFSEADINRLRQQLAKFEGILAAGASEDTLKAFDAETEALLADVFGNPSEIFEAYAYAQLGEAGGLINLPEEAQLEGDQDMSHQSLQQRKGVLAQGLAELEARQTHKG